jgi:hypothetical protein
MAWSNPLLSARRLAFSLVLLFLITILALHGARQGIDWGGQRLLRLTQLQPSHDVSGSQNLASGGIESHSNSSELTAAGSKEDLWLSGSTELDVTMSTHEV